MQNLALNLFSNIKKIILLQNTKTLVCAILLVFSHAVFAESSDWELKKTEDDISIYMRDVPDSAINAIRAVTQINAPLDVVLDLLWDASKRPEWNSLCREVKPVASENPGNPQQQTNYFYYDMPWPVKDRDLIMGFTKTVDQNSAKISASIVDAPVAENKNAVRVSYAWEEWEISRNEDGSSTLSMTAFLDPNGPIPAWLINTMSISQPLEVMTKLRAMSLARAKESAP